MKTHPTGTIIHCLFESRQMKHDRLLHINEAVTGKEVFEWIAEERDKIEKQQHSNAVLLSVSIL